MVWTYEKYLTFIEDYRKCSVLWDVRNPNYTNNYKKRKIVIGLAKKYGLDEASVKKKIKNLRSAFHREHHRLTNKLKDEDEVDGIRKWFAYDALKFILDVTGPNKKEETSCATEDSFPDVPDDDQGHFDINTQYIQLPERHEPPERSKSPETSQSHTPASKEEDEFDLFGRSMTVQLRKMPELVALDLMQKMQLMVYNAKKQLCKARNKRKLKICKIPVQAKVTSKKKVQSPMSHESSPRSTSPIYKFEAISPGADTTRASDKIGQDFYEYVTNMEDDPYGEGTSEDPSDINSKRRLKRKNLNSIDPLDVKECKISSTHVKSEIGN